MRYRYYLLLAFLFVIATQLRAQVNPPELLCIRDDSLFWEIPVNPCGPFQGYEIYFSNNGPAGPYTLLATITDAAQTAFFHSNQTNELRHYYMQSLFDCPGEPLLSSDTIDNQLPLAAPISSASVTGFFTGAAQSEVELTWPASPSPETVGYVIYRNTPQGTIPIDTVFNGLSYIDDQVDPTAATFTYYVLALDACGNISLFGDPHTTMLLDYSVSVCQQTAFLNWLTYEGWPDGVGSYEIWVSENGAPGQAVDTVPGNENFYALRGLTDQVDYIIGVRAIRPDGQAAAFSNTRSFSTEIVQPIRQLEVFNLTVNEDNLTEISWRWNTNAELTSAIVWVYERGDDIIQALVDYPLSTPQDVDPSLLLPKPVQDRRPFYFVETIDNCDTTARTPEVSPVFLQVKALAALRNQLIWEPLQLAGSEVGGYEIHRVDVNGNSQLIATVDTPVVSYVDEISSSDQQLATSCYFVTAVGSFRFAEDGSQIPLRSESNRACAEQDALIYVPNAFAPYGRNPEFKPVLVFGATLEEYTFQIFDRWGRQVFQTSDIGQGWNGRFEGQDLPAGVYVYRIFLQRPSGEQVEEKGSVMLLR